MHVRQGTRRSNDTLVRYYLVVEARTTAANQGTRVAPIFCARKMRLRCAILRGQGVDKLHCASTRYMYMSCLSSSPVCFFERHLMCTGANVCPENVDGGVALTDCGGNVFCWHEPLDTCCTDGSDTFYVKPRTGEVKNPSAKDTDADSSPPGGRLTVQPYWQAFLPLMAYSANRL
jgi:hypothetical protein